MNLGTYDGDGFTIYINMTETYIGDGSGGKWYHWNCTCSSKDHQFRTLAMMESSMREHIGEHALGAES